MALAVATGACDRFDYFTYDLLQRQIVREPDRKILLVVIDNRSLEEFGAWPWPRETDARLVANLGKAHPRAIGLDILLLEPRGGNGDRMLAQAIIASRPVFVPVEFDVPGQNGAAFRVAEPGGPLSGAATGLANVNLAPDGDGQIRRAYLDYTDGHTVWPSLAWLLASHDLPRNSTLAGRPPVQRVPTHGPLAGSRPVLINYVGPAGSFPSVSAASILRGEVPDELLRNRLILVGATASGIGDVHATPVGIDGSLMPGIEIQANLLDTILSNRAIIPVRGIALYVFAMAPLVALLVALRFMQLHRTLALIAGLLAAICGLTAGLLYFADWWLPPGSALLGMGLVYPLWTWRKLAVAVGYVSVELRRSANEVGPLERATPDLQHLDFFDQQMARLRMANDRERDLRRFLIDRLTQMPDGVIVTNLLGEVALANAGATSLFEELNGGGSLQRADELLKYFDRQGSAGRSKLEFSVVAKLSATPWTCQAQTGAGKSYHIRFEPQRSSDNDVIGYVVRIVDISQQVTLQRQREDVLQLLTHDMRAPQASIIALLDSLDDGEIGAETSGRVRSYATRTLKLADDFVHLARAQALKYTFAEVDFSELVRDAVDALWPQSKSRNILISLSVPEEAIILHGEGSLLMRMLINLIDNAVKYSDSPGHVYVDLVQTEQGEAPFARLSVSNTGVGIAPEQIAVLYQRFQRGSLGPAHGVGLGLSFVHTVVVRHHGAIFCDSAVNGQTCFTIAIPLDPRLITGDSPAWL